VRIQPARAVSVFEGGVLVARSLTGISPHVGCVLDDAGNKRAGLEIQHTADGVAALVARLGRLGDPVELPVAIERPDGRLVDRLLEAGHPVVPVKANATKTRRDGEVLSGAKSDLGDAQVIAE
jgi:Transposase